MSELHPPDVWAGCEVEIPPLEPEFVFEVAVVAESAVGVVIDETVEEFPITGAATEEVALARVDMVSSEPDEVAALESFGVEPVPSKRLLKRPTMSRRPFDCVGVVAGAVSLEPTSFDPVVGEFSVRAPVSAER